MFLLSFCFVVDVVVVIRIRRIRPFSGKATTFVKLVALDGTTAMHLSMSLLNYLLCNVS